MKKLTVISICLALVFCVSFATSVMASDEEDALRVLEEWKKAANTGDSQLISSLYWHSQELTEFAPFKGGAFLIQGWDALEQWFKPFFEMPAGTMSHAISNPQVTLITNDVAVLTCYQTMTINPPLVKEQTIVQNRVTFVVQKIGGKWLIVHDHASALPTE